MPNLKSTTALAVSLSLAMPTVAPAQNADRGFPCISPSGELVQNPNQLGRAILAFLNEEDPKERGNAKDAEACGPEAIQTAIDDGGEEMAAAISAAPEDRLAALTDTTAPETTAESETETAEASEEAPTQGTDEAEVPLADAEETTEQDVAEDAPAEETETEPTEEPATEQAETDEQSPETTAEGENSEERATEETAEAASTEQPEDTQQATNTEETTEPETTEQAETATETDASAIEAETETAETGTTEEPTKPEVVETQAGEAGGEQLTDAERQELAQVREEEDAPAAAAAAEPEDAQAEAETEVETQTVTEEDVRSAADDFETTATGAPQADAEANSDRGMSDFEKALVLGIGAAVVGSILNNGDQVISNSGDRVVVERDGELRVLKNDDVLLRRPGAQVETRTFNDGSSRTTVSYEDGSQIITVRSAEGAVLRRTLIRASDGTEVVLFDDTETVEPVEFEELPEIETIEEMQENVALNDQDALRAALRKALLADVGRTFSLRQIRDYKRVRGLAPQVELEALTFETGSAAIQPDQAEVLAELGWAIRDVIDENPGAVFLVEGHTDAVGSASYNLALSDRRAETVALALTEYFDVPPQNLITQGYGESDLKVPVLSDERANRRAAIRNITNLLGSN